MEKYVITKIEIFLTPQKWDNYNNPYFWVIMGYIQDSWVNTGICGWESSPENAWKKALEESKNIT